MSETTVKPQRLVALDVFRGLTIALMFIVNNPGTWSFVYPPLLHAKWSGWTPTDWVFPFFLFTVGTAAWFSLKKYEGRPPRDVYFKIIKRGILIFLIGLGLNLFLNSLSSFHNLRIMGVLQRIGIAYLIGSIVCVSFNKKIVAAIGGILLIGYWLLMKMTGHAQYPYGFHDGTHYIGVAENIVTRFDQWLLGTSHLYKGYDGIPFDPEGLLSTIPSVVTVICGFLTGSLIDANPSRIVLVKRMLMWGAGALLVGWLLNFEFPINKPIWSSSYVIFMAGWCLVFNAILIWLIDVQGLKGWTKPIIVLGMNSLLAFVVSGVYVKTISKLKFDSGYEVVTQKGNNQTMPKQIGGYQKLYETVFSPITTPYQMLKNVKDKTVTKDNNPSVWADFTERQKLSSFLFAVFHVFLFWLILWVFYKKGIFLKV